jgi:hypothetical protein
MCYATAFIELRPRGMEAHDRAMPQWADVYLDRLDERLSLEPKALFFVPEALARCSAAGLTATSLSALSQAERHAGGAARAGRSAITKVLKIVPVSYESAVGFLAVANRALALRGGGELTLDHIVACVFRLKDPSEVARALGASALDIARACGLTEQVASAALGRYRLQFRDAIAIWSFLRERKIAASSARPGPEDPTLSVVTENPMDFVRTDMRPPVAIRSVGEEGFVYDWRNLRPAPPTGHPWARGPLPADGA